MGDLKIKVEHITLWDSSLKSVQSVKMDTIITCGKDNIWWFDNANLYLSSTPHGTSYPEAKSSHIINIYQCEGYRQSQQIETTNIADGNY